MTSWGWSEVRSLAVGLLILALVLIAGCAAARSDSVTTGRGQAIESAEGLVTSASTDAGPPTTECLFQDGVWELRIDRQGGSEDPDEAFGFLPEARYHPIENGTIYRVVIWDRGNRVSVEGTWGTTPFVAKGTRSSATTDEKAWYDLSDTTAGGRFVVWQTREGLQGEVTVYGSGRPIVRSERGEVRRAP